MSVSLAMPEKKSIRLTRDIIAAYVSKNHVAAADLPALIVSVHTAIRALSTGEPAPAAAETTAKPSPVQIRKSVRADSLISFLDGRPYKTLKRHLTSHGLTPAAYCEKFGLPPDYPMVAPDYSERRSRLAKGLGLGVPGAQAARNKARD